MIDYQEPENIYDAMADLEFDKALDSDDPRYVDTLGARGDFKMRELYRYLRINDSDPEHLKLPKRLPASNYNLFCGHIGCGKSTELRRVKDKLHQKDLFFVVFLDILKELDIHNLSYADGRTTVVPVHSGEVIGTGLLNKILRDCDVSQEELQQLL